MKFSLLLLLTLVLFLGMFGFIQKGPSSNKTIENDEPSDWFMAQRTYPYGTVDYGSYKKALQTKISLVSNHTERDQPAWLLEGPINVGGRVQDIEMDPTNTNIIYAGAATGGIFKSEDAGVTWIPIFDAQPSLSIGDIAIATSDPNIIYAGTGEPNCGGGSITYDGMGIYKSTDAGENWSFTGLDSTRNTGRIIIDPQNSERVWAATMGDLFANDSNRGIYRTTDGGATWQQVLFLTDSTGAIDLAIHPQHTDTIYACMWERIRRPTYEHYGGSSCGIYRSFDGGDTWTQLTSGLPSGNNVGRIGIDISQSDPNTLYAIYADKTGYFMGLFKTTDGGNTWGPTNDASLGSMFASYGWWFGRIKCDPTSSSIVYAIGFNEYKTTDGGFTWNYSDGTMHVDHHTMYIHPLDHNLIYDGNDGGVYRSTNGSGSWTHILNLPISQFYTCEIDNLHPSHLYGGLQDNGVVRTLTGNTNDWQAIIGGDGFYILVDPTNNNYQYGEYQYGAFERSTDGGSSFYGATTGISSFDRTNWNTPVVFNPLNPKSLYLGTNRLYKSVNRAASWNAISNDLTNGSTGSNITFGTITAISVSPADTSVIYVGTDDGNVQVSTNNGSSWANVSSSLPDRWVTRVTCDPYNAMRAYVTFSGYRFYDNMVHVYMTNDQGQTWESIAGDLPDIPTSDIIVDPDFDSTLYIATDIGVFMSTNLGTNWTVLGIGLPLAPVTDIKLHEPTRTLIAATYGRSMHSLDLSELPTSSQTLSLIASSISVYPNPAQSVLKVEFNCTTDGDGVIEMYDVSGKAIWNSNQFFKKGKNQFKWNIKDGNTGIYFLNIEVGDRRWVKKVMVM